MSTRCQRCLWNDLYENYHDTEWWVPVYDDRVLFEFLILEWAQAWLNRLTVLKKRENYRKAFAGFDPQKVAQFNEKIIGELLQNPWIIKNKLKVRSAVKNALIFLDIQKEFASFSEYFRWWTGGQVIQNERKTLEEVPAATPLAEQISKDLKKRGMNFVGPTIMYAYMQAVGMVNDHVTWCVRRSEVQLISEEWGVRN